MKMQTHKKDEMTPIERGKAIAVGSAYDRIPCFPFIEEISGKLIGVPVEEYCHNADDIVQSEIAAFHRLGHDIVGTGPNTCGIAEAIGAPIIYSKVALPHVGEPFLMDYEMLSQMDILNPSKDGRLPMYLEAIEKLTQAAEEVVAVSSSMGGPFTIASQLRGIEQFLKDCRREPKRVHELMQFVSDSSLMCIDAVAPFGVVIAFADPVACPNMISPKCYETFVLPYMKELVQYSIQKTGKKPSLHMCGDTHKIWPYLKELSISGLSLDNLIDMKIAREELGHTFAILGNVPPVEVVLDGTKEEIFASVKQCIEDSIESEKGYTLTTGCDVPYQTAFEKLDWFMEAGRLYGRRDSV
ncbi:MAG: uroporphyrinogen decarboxylase family protein [Lachnospiraceae bacterium]